MADVPAFEYSGETITVEILDKALAYLAHIIVENGDYGMKFKPIFDRLHSERTKLIDFEDRLKEALGRAS